jgi:hypothetical protein
MAEPAFEDPFPNFDIFKPIDCETPGEGFEKQRRGSLASILTVSRHSEDNVGGSTASLLICFLQNSDKVLIINEELYFNGQQLAFVVFVMVICYYMGKFSCTSKC